MNTTAPFRVSNRLALTVTAVVSAVMLLAGCGAVSTGIPDPETVARIESGFRADQAQSAGFSDYGFWHGGDGEHWAVGIVDGFDGLVIVDAEKGGEIRRLGKHGAEKDEFDDPIAITVVDGMAFVLERGNRRIQVVEFPECASLGFFAVDRLHDPVDFALFRIELGAFYAYILDTAEIDGQPQTHVLRYACSRAVNTFHDDYLATFGYSPGDGFLRNATGIAVDRDARQVLVTEKHAGGVKTRVFTLDGDFVGLDVNR